MNNERMASTARLLKILAHPVRLQILKKLMQGQKCVNDIHEFLGIAQPGTSQHLSILKKAGILACRKNGTTRCYHLVDREFVRNLFFLLEKNRLIGQGP